MFCFVLFLVLIRVCPFHLDAKYTFTTGNENSLQTTSGFQFRFIFVTAVDALNSHVKMKYIVYCFLTKISALFVIDAY